MCFASGGLFGHDPARDELVELARAMKVYQLRPDGDEARPRINAGHPRNRGIDFIALGRYLRGEARAPAPEPNVFVKIADGQLWDAFYMAMSPWLISDRLRRVVEPLIAQDVVFVPMHVNGERFWGLRVTRVLPTAVDLNLSEVRYLPSGSLDRIVVPVWRATQIPDPSLFAIPQQRNTAWTTDALIEAYTASGCTGISFWERGRVVES